MKSTWKDILFNLFKGSTKPVLTEPVKKTPITITYVTQPENTPLCVPTVIAMLTGGRIGEMLEHFNTEPRGFYLPEMLQFLEHKGIEVKEHPQYTWIKELEDLPHLAIVVAPARYEKIENVKHCLLWNGNRIIDPLDPTNLELGQSWLDIQTERVFEVIDY